MTDLALIATDPTQLEPLGPGDAGQFVVLACERAKSWLTQAIEHGEIDQIIEVKSQAEAIRVYTRQKELGKDAELAAAEIVRRAERGLGIAVKRGQDDGTIRTQGQSGGPKAPYQRGDGRTVQVDPRCDDSKISPTSVFASVGERKAAYALADVPDDEFEDALDEARSEGSLSRANVKRKATEEHKLTPDVRKKIIADLADSSLTSEQIARRIHISPDRVRFIARQLGITIHADKVMGRTNKKLDPNHIIEETVHALDGLASGMALVDFDAVDASRVPDWDASLKSFQTALNRFRKQLNKETSQ